LQQRSSTPQDLDEFLVKINNKVKKMIKRGRAALVSTVEVKDVDMLLAEDKEREEKIMKEFGDLRIHLKRFSKRIQ